jgi:ubiquinone/menaquinone biosynthesis C-methylase UbiE
MSRTDLKEKLFKFYNTCEDYFKFTTEANKVPTEERKEMIKFIPENSKVLDVACGTAENAELISQKAFYYSFYKYLNAGLFIVAEKKQ